MIHARSVTNGLGGPFRVSGGPFTSEQTMGWHMTDENGFTVAISCDAQFVERVQKLLGEVVRHDDGQFVIEATFPGYLDLSEEQRQEITERLQVAGADIAAVIRRERESAEARRLMGCE